MSATPDTFKSIGSAAGSIVARLRVKMLRKFDRYYIPEPNSGCWLWLMKPHAGGYGRLCQDGEVWRAHRASWLLHRGPIPDGLLVCHHCDNPACVNPDHLFLGTHDDNTQDCVSKGRLNPARGEAQGQSILTDEKAREIVRDPRLTREIAKDYDIHTTVVCAIKNGHRWVHATNGERDVRGFKGERNGNSKLTEPQVKAIRSDKRRASLVAKEYAVSRRMIWAIRTRRHWSHVAD